MLADTRLKSVLATVRLETCSEAWVNISLYQWRSTLLTAAGSKISGGRFHRKGKAPALYFAKSPVVALLEVGALAKAQDGALVPISRPPQMLVSANITIPAGILDLIDSARRRELKTNLQELTGLWVLEPYPATQRLGQAAYDSNRIVAIRYPSSLGEQLEPNLVVFVDRLLAHRGARLEAHDPNGDLPKTVRPLVGP